jgi:hypothetical protein
MNLSVHVSIAQRTRICHWCKSKILPGQGFLEVSGWKAGKNICKSCCGQIPYRIMEAEQRNNR